LILLFLSLWSLIILVNSIIIGIEKQIVEGSSYNNYKSIPANKFHVKLQFYYYNKLEILEFKF